MMIMNPTEALQTIVDQLGVPQTKRDDNLSPDQVKLRNSVKILEELVKEHGQSNKQ